MFRGTKKYGPRSSPTSSRKTAARITRSPPSDFTDYFEVINRDHLDVPIALEADRMANFEPKGFDSEKAVVMEERRLRTEDNPEDALAEMTQAQAFVAHPYHWPVIGWMHDMQGLTLEDALNYHASTTRRKTRSSVAVGDFDGDKVIKQISANLRLDQERPQAAAGDRSRTAAGRRTAASCCATPPICRPSPRPITCPTIARRTDASRSKSPPRFSPTARARACTRTW